MKITLFASWPFPGKSEIQKSSNVQQKKKKHKINGTIINDRENNKYVCQALLLEDSHNFLAGTPVQQTLFGIFLIIT